MERLLSEEQYSELAQFWQEFMLLGPTRQQENSNLTGLALDFSEWIDRVEDEPYYGLPEIWAFFAEKKQREGTERSPSAKEPTLLELAREERLAGDQAKATMQGLRPTIGQEQD